MNKFLFLLTLCMVCCSPSSTWAAISFVGSCENSAANGADVTLTLPSTDANDLVIVAYAVGDTGGSNVNMTVISPASTFTEVADLFANDTQQTNLGVYWDITDDSYTQVTVDGLGGTNASTAAVCMVFRGVDTTTPMDVTPVGGTTLNTMHADPGPIDHNNPSGVWTVIVGASGHTLGATGTYTFPSGYTTNALEAGADDTGGDITVGMAYRSSGVSDPEDPGTMTHSGSNSSNFSSATTTIALRPDPTPSAPQNLTTTSTTAGVSASWTAPADSGGSSVQTYGIWRATEPFTATTSATLIASISAAGTTYSDTSAAHGTVYYYRVSATNSTATSSLSNMMSSSSNNGRIIRMKGVRLR